jgi:hypothetical protein
MTKTEIDNYFTENYKLLKSVAKGITYKSFTTCDPDTLITQSYLHVLKERKEIDSTDKLQRYAIAKIKQEANFSQSESNRTFRVNACENENTNISEPDTIIDKIEQEMELINMKATLALYEIRQTDCIKRIVLEAYTKKGCNTVRKLATYFNISPASSNKIIKEIFEELRILRKFENYEKI